MSLLCHILGGGGGALSDSDAARGTADDRAIQSPTGSQTPGVKNTKSYGLEGPRRWWGKVTVAAPCRNSGVSGGLMPLSQERRLRSPQECAGAVID